MTKDIPLLDFFDDEPMLTAEKCVKPEIKHIYHEKCISRNITTAVLFWDQKESKISDILDDCETLVEDVAWKSYIWKKKVLLVMLRIGAPIAASAVEELKIYGIKNFIAVGTSGSIDSNISDDLIIVINRAIRDEGTSYQYLPPSTYVDLDKNLAGKLSEYLQTNGAVNIQGTTWTTDGFYRETPKRIAKRISQGAVCVEMECAALAAAAQHHKLNFCQFVWFSDKADTKDWTWLGNSEQRGTFKAKMLLLALNFCVNLTV